MQNWHDTTTEVESTATIKRRRVETDAEMDITPMIDITFLLLIFFLVASTPDMQAAIELPPAQHGLGVSQRTATIISVGESGQENAPIYLADGKKENALITGSLEAQQQKIVEYVKEGLAPAKSTDKPKTDVLIKADRNVKHRDVARAIKAVSRVEGIQIHLAVLETGE